MGTRSDIIVERTDGKWARIYCHWDGYISNNGKLLQDHYNDQMKAEALVALGDMSSLGEVIGEKHDFDWRDAYHGPRAKNQDDPEFARLIAMCLYYGRDRGETGVDATIGDTLSEVWPDGDTGTEFTYVWSRADASRNQDNPMWWVGNPDEGSQSLMPLADAIEADDKGEVPVKSAIKAFGGNFVIGQR